MFKGKLRKVYVKCVLVIKDNHLIRRIMSPLVQATRLHNLKSYANSDDSERVKGLKDAFYGKTCYIIGNGPSLKIADLELLNNEYTFAANKIYTVFGKTKWRPTFYSCMDSEAYKLYGEKLSEIEAEYLFYDVSAKKYLKRYSNSKIYFICQYTKFPENRWDSVHPFISEDVSKMVSCGMTVTFTAIQMAIYMGFKRIYLLGVDHRYAKQITRDGKVIINSEQKDYGEGIEDTDLGQQYVDATTEAYEVARLYCDSNNIEIYNATRGGKLEAFERVNFDEIIKSKM